MLTVKLPFILYIACVVRIIHWRQERVSAHDSDDVIQRLRSTVWLAFGMGAGCTIWSLSLYPYGGPFEQGHVAFYMALTVVGCIFCLIHLRAAALALTTVVLVPYTIFFVMTGNHVLIAIAMNMLLVAAAMIYVLLAHDRDFSSLIETQKQLLARQSETQRLSDENFRLANVDSLTGLPNRRSFFGALNIVLEKSRHSHKPFAVGLIDLDRIQGRQRSLRTCDRGSAAHRSQCPASRKRQRYGDRGAPRRR